MKTRKRDNAAVMGAILFSLSLLWLTSACERSVLKPTPIVPPTPAHVFVVDANTVALWHLNETSGQVVPDVSGNGLDLTLGSDATAEAVDPTWSAPGENGFAGCLSFDGAQGPYAARTGSYALPGEFTVDLWVNSASMTTETILLKSDNVAFEVLLRDDGSVLFRIGDGTTTVDCTTSSGAISAGSWSYIACTYNLAAMRIFINAMDYAYCPATLTLTPPTNVYLGGQPSRASFDGRMDEVRISNIARSQGAINAYYYAY